MRQNCPIPHWICLRTDNTTSFLTTWKLDKGTGTCRSFSVTGAGLFSGDILDAPAGFRGMPVAAVGQEAGGFEGSC
ncbi:Ribosomal protein [Trema orientale]|uniref:Ribosomal protein n=1 Tax=Trema orientale TaxID=63057 RepID=A0A2P5FN46_TREOI|nr:Ribosomal protein [Trema orientale]